MKDLVTRLRDRWADGNAALEQEAADKIEAQQAALVKCVEALHNSLPVGTDPIAICERHDAAIAKAERLIK